MLKKRIIGTIIVLDGLAVQSFGYQKYLPLGKPAVLVENLDRWGVDEIFIQSIDRSSKNLGPDFDLINEVVSVGVHTPIIYGGGVCCAQDATKLISAGVERIVVDAFAHNHVEDLHAISKVIGAQALLVNLPVTIKNNAIFRFNHVTRCDTEIDTLEFINSIKESISELIVSDREYEGFNQKFSPEIASSFSNCDKSLILFGGISSPEQIKTFFKQKNVSAVAIGNSLNYREQAVQKLKQKLTDEAVRPPYFN